MIYGYKATLELLDWPHPGDCFMEFEQELFFYCGTRVGASVLLSH
jgi:hypothetical protein